MVEFNDYLLKQESSDQYLLLNTIALSNQLDNTFVLFINNPEDNILSWKDLLMNMKHSNEEKANHGDKFLFCLFVMRYIVLEIELYYEYKQNQNTLPSAGTQIEGYQSRTQLYSRASSSKTYITEITEKSSIWETSTVASRPATSFVLNIILSLRFICLL